MRKNVTLGLLLCLTLGARVNGQDVASVAPRFLFVAGDKSAPVAIDVSRTPMLRKRVNLDLENVSVKDALAAIARESGLRLSYVDNLIAGAQSKRLRVEGITVAAALTDVLSDLDVDVVFSKDGSATIVKRDRSVALIQTGTITGRVIDSTAGEGIAGATVSVERTRLSATSGPDGSYVLRGVPAGSQTVTVRKLGFSTRSRSVSVSDNATATLDFVLVRAPTTLTEIVVTPTGDRQRLEVGNAIGTIKADSIVQTSLIRNMSDLLTARTPGVIVTARTGKIGDPTFVRIRGQGSVSLSNDPIIVLDGIRLTPASNFGAGTSIGRADNFVTGAGSGNAQAATTTRLDDIDPNTIESMDVLRGPSAASLYGTEAAAGVIVIKTKKGATGPYRVNLLADYGTSHVPGKMPLQWVSFGHLPNGTPTAECYLYMQGRPNVFDHTCVQDSVRAYDRFGDPRLSTLGTGMARNLSANLSGGSERLQEFLSLRVSDAVGVAKLSAVEEDRVARMWGGPAPSWVLRPNQEKNVTGASRTNLHPAQGLDLSLTANGIYRNTLGNSPLALANLSVSRASLARELYDTLVYLPAERQRAKLATIAKRGYATAGGIYTPLSWLVLRGNVGGDYTITTNEGLARASDCTAILNPSGCPSGHGSDRAEIFVATVDLGAQASWSPRTWVSLRTSTGEQLNRTKFYALRVLNTSSNLAFGTDLFSPTPVSTSPGQQLFQVLENRDESATAGWYLEETASLRERLFLTAAFRQDVASAFGSNVNEKAPIYPKYSASWLVSNEPFFPKTPWVSSLRLRTAYGHSGQSARQTAVVNSYQNFTSYLDGNVVPAIGLFVVGNANLRPERTHELEGGFDLSLLENERVNLEATLYRKLSDDAITNLSLAPTLGVNCGCQVVNLGRVENRGWEVAATMKLLDQRAVGWDITVNASRNTNKLVSSSIARLPRGGSRGDFVGYPLQSFFAHVITGYADFDGDGFLQREEVRFGSELRYMGSVTPESEITYSNSVRLWDGALRVNANFDQVNGQAGTGFGGFIGDAPMTYHPATLAEQAAFLQAFYDISSFSSPGYVGKQSTLRLAELSLTALVPQRVASRFLRARTASVTIAGRNLALWTTSVDKEPNMNGAFDRPNVDIAQSFGGIPHPRDITFRVNLGY